MTNKKDKRNYFCGRQIRKGHGTSFLFMTNKSFSGDRSVAFGLPSPPLPRAAVTYIAMLRRRFLSSRIIFVFCLHFYHSFLFFFRFGFIIFFYLFFIGIGFHCPSWWGRGEGCRMVSSSFDFDFALVCLMLQFDVAFFSRDN